MRTLVRGTNEFKRKKLQKKLRKKKKKTWVTIFSIIELEPFQIHRKDNLYI